MGFTTTTDHPYTVAADLMCLVSEGYSIRAAAIAGNLGANIGAALFLQWRAAAILWHRAPSAPTLSGPDTAAIRDLLVVGRVILCRFANAGGWRGNIGTLLRLESDIVEAAGTAMVFSDDA